MQNRAHNLLYDVICYMILKLWWNHVKQCREFPHLAPAGWSHMGGVLALQSKARPWALIYFDNMSVIFVEQTIQKRDKLSKSFEDVWELPTAPRESIRSHGWCSHITSYPNHNLKDTNGSNKHAESSSTPVNCYVAPYNQIYMLCWQVKSWYKYH